MESLIRPAPPDIQTWLGHEWQDRERGIPILAAGAVWVGGGAIHTFDLPFLVGLAVGTATVIAMMISVGSGHRFSQKIQLHLFISAVWAMGFLTWSSIDSVWINEQLRMVTLCGGVIWPLISMLTWKDARFAQINKEAERTARWYQGQQPKQITVAPQVVEPAVTRAAQLWQNMFAEWGVHGLKFVGQRATKEGNRIIRMRLPANGSVRFGQVLDKAENVEIAMSSMGQVIPPGAVSIRRVKQPDGQMSSTDFVITLDLVDILSHIRWMPDDHTPRSITQAFQVGVWQDGTPMFMTVQEIHWAIIALSRAGKSNLLHVIIYQASRCYDCVVWGIDMKGASTLKPWLKPYLDQAVHPDTGKPVLRPVIDWLAVDKFEAERMVRAFIEIADDRPFRHSGGKLMVSREHPHILLIADEVSRLTGSHANSGTNKGAASGTFGALFVDACSIGAGEGCTLIYATQRNTVDFALPGNAQANVKGRVCLGAADLQDVRMVLPKNPMAASVANILHHKGSLVMAAGEVDDALAGRSFFMGEHAELDARTYEAALIHGNIVPGLRRGTYEYEVACRWGYEDRFDDPERIGWVHGTHKGRWYGKPLEPAAPAVDIPTQPTAATATAAARPAAPTADTGFFTPPPAAQPVSTDPFDQILAAEDFSDLLELGKEFEDASDQASSAAEPGDADKVQMVIDIVDAYGATGCMAADIITRLLKLKLITREGKSAAHRWLKQARDESHGDRRIVQPGGKRTRYYTQRNVHATRRAA